MLGSAQISRAGSNPDVIAYLTWSPDSVVTNLTEMPSGTKYLYLRLDGVVDLAGCEFLLLWSPAGETGSGCYEFISGQHPSGSGSDCSWLMRGSQVEGMNESASNSWKVAFAADESNRGCEEGNVARVMFDFSMCDSTVPGWFSPAYVLVSDSNAELDTVAVSDTVTVASSVAYAGGERSFLRQAAVSGKPGATVLGGVDVELPPYLQSVRPVMLQAGDGEQAFSLSGFNLGNVERVYLRNASSLATGDAYTGAPSSRGVSCSLWLGSDMAGSCDVVVESSGGQTATLPGKLQVLASPDEPRLNGSLLTQALADSLERMPSDEKVPLFVVLRNQLDSRYLSMLVDGMTKDERRRTVIRELKEFAKLDQGPILELLQQMKAAGKVRSYVSLWLINSFHMVGDIDAVSAVSSQPGIRYMDLGSRPDAPPPSTGSAEGYTGEPVVGGDIMPTSSAPDTAWQVKHINAPQVWEMGYKGKGVLVGVLDTGIDENAPDLVGGLWHNPNGEVLQTSPPYCDEDYNGYADDYYGLDISWASSPIDPGSCSQWRHGALGDVFYLGWPGHGTGDAGFICGDGTNGTQTGIAPLAKVMSLQNGLGSLDRLGLALQYAMDFGACVFTCSMGGTRASEPAMREMMENLLVDGAVFCQAGDNVEIGVEENVPKEFISPGNCPPPWRNPYDMASGGVSAAIAVGGSGRFAPDSVWNYVCYTCDSVAFWGVYEPDDTTYFRSAYGPCKWDTCDSEDRCYHDYPYPPGLIRPDILAPAVQVEKVAKTGGSSDYFRSNGVSNSAPQVAGVIALMLSKNNELLPAEIDSILETTAANTVPPPENPPDKDNKYGAGRVDALAAVKATSFFNNFNRDSAACWFPQGGSWRAEQDAALDTLLCYGGQGSAGNPGYDNASLFYESREGKVQFSFDFVIRGGRSPYFGAFLRWADPDTFLLLRCYKQVDTFMVDLIRKKRSTIEFAVSPTDVGMNLSSGTAYHFELVDSAEVDSTRRLSFGFSWGGSQRRLVWNDVSYVPGVRLGDRRGLFVYGNTHVHFDNVYCGAFVPGKQEVVAADPRVSAEPSLKLCHNYPNPFNPVTVIEYSLPRRAPVRLQIFDVSGRLVRWLVKDRVQQPGFYKIQWDGRNDSGREVASGVYFLSLSVEGQRRSAKLVVVR